MSDNHNEDENLYRTIVDMIPQIVWTATPDGSQDFANLRWYEFNGLEQGKPDPEPWQPRLDIPNEATGTFYSLLALL